MHAQTDIDNAYISQCYIIKAEKRERLESKRILINLSSISNKRRRIGKPWWRETLSEQLNRVRKAEKEWLKCKLQVEDLFLSLFSIRKEFDRLVQRAKRVDWFNIQSELLSGAESNNDEFWKSVGRVGVAHSRDKRIPMEVVLDGERVESNLESVLHQWKTDFSSLFNRA